MKIIVTGGAGFIGSYLVERLASEGHDVVVIDNLSSGSLKNLEGVSCRFVKADLKVFGDWVEEFGGADVCFHFAANPEVRVSTTHPRIHFDENVVATFNVLEACRVKGVKYLVFASSSTVYGDAKVFPTPENHPIEPVSVYGASKASCEVFIGTYCRLYGLSALILRYANIIGRRSRHGVIYDFILKLLRNPRKLEILGDGTQRKSYLYIKDAVDATLHLTKLMLDGKLGENPAVFNVGNDDWVTVKEIADIVVDVMGLENVEYVYKPATPDGRGWPGDVKFMLLDITKLKSTGWSPELSSKEAVRKTAEELYEELSQSRNTLH